MSAPSVGSATEQAALQECVALRTTGEDRLLTAKWFFAVMAQSPHIVELSAVREAHRKDFDRKFARLFTRIVTKDCAVEVRPVAIKSIEAAFEQVGRALGETAMTELMSAKEVDSALGAYTEFLSDEEFQQLIDSLPKPTK